MPNQNWLKGICCPKCKQDEGPFVIDVRCRLQTHDDQFKNEDGCWIDDDAYCQCPKCEYSAQVEDFKQKRTSAETLTIIDADATALFEDESTDWSFCVERAPWQHKEACEFMLYTWRDDSDQYFNENIRKMTEYGCSEKLIALVKLAREHKAAWLMLHA